MTDGINVPEVVRSLAACEERLAPQELRDMIVRVIVAGFRDGDEVEPTVIVPLIEAYHALVRQRCAEQHIRAGLETVSGTEAEEMWGEWARVGYRAADPSLSGGLPWWPTVLPLAVDYFPSLIMRLAVCCGYAAGLESRAALALRCGCADTLRREVL